jgi:hypothetical protein
MLAEADLATPPKATTAVLVGQMISPGQIAKKRDGTEVHTLWGELAWQLGGDESYRLVADADRSGTSPGAALVDLLRRHAPCLVLIDEWVAYARQLYGVDGLPAGSFDAQFTFAQALAEATRAVEGALLVVSIPASDIEVGGEGGRAALERLKNVIGRVESSWRPASAEEGFEIVRRRLFDDLPADKAPQRDAVVRAFGGLYRSQRGEFPGGCTEGDYERRLTAAYPIHPELFDRLYGEWSTLDKFQRTRGVLRLMAAVVHELWERNDPSLLIMPATIPIDAPAVSSELTRYLEEGWTPVIESDVDGPNALPLRLDRDNPNLGRYSATRRVARTIYLGSAPTQQAANRGLDDRSIKLGCVQPGEAPATFGDALRRLTDQATYLYVDGQRYWYSLQPSVTRLARDRAVSHFADDDVDEEIRRRLKPAERQRGDFAAVHAAPAAPGDVPDDPEARLVVFGPEHPHSGKTVDSPARVAAQQFLDKRAAGDRFHRNMEARQRRGPDHRLLRCPAAHGPGSRATLARRPRQPPPALERLLAVPLLAAPARPGRPARRGAGRRGLAHLAFGHLRLRECVRRGERSLQRVGRRRVPGCHARRRERRGQTRRGPAPDRGGPQARRRHRRPGRTRRGR